MLVSNISCVSTFFAFLHSHILAFLHSRIKNLNLRNGNISCREKTFMPKALIIINRLNIGGPASHAAYLTKYLQPDFETMLITGQIGDSEGNADYMAKELGIEPQYIKNMHRSINPKNDRKGYGEIKKIIKKFQPDVVHTHAAKPGALGRLAAYNCGVKNILHTFHGHVFHSYFSPMKTRFFLEAERYLAKRSSSIIAISPLQKKELVEDFKICTAEKMEVVRLGYDFKKFYENLDEKRVEFRSKWGIDEDEIAIGIVGRLVPVKNHGLFLEALKIALNQSSIKKIKAFIIGDGESKTEIFQKAKALNLHISDSADKKAQIIFTSWIKDIEKAYAGLDIVCLSSLNEGTPVSLLEAQAAGCHIVSTNVGGVKDVVDDQAFLSESGDIEAFAQNLVESSQNYDYKIRSLNIGNHKTIKEYSLESMINRHKKLYFKYL